MGEFIDAMDAVSVEVESPSRAVRVTVSRMDDTKIHINRGARETMSDLQLEDEIAYTVQNAWTAIKAKIDNLLRALGKDYSKRAMTRRQAPRTEKMRGEMSQVVAVARSSREFVAARMSGRGELRLKFRNNALTRTDLATETLQQEIEDAIRRAKFEWSRQIKALYTQYRPQR